MKKLHCNGSENRNRESAERCACIVEGNGLSPIFGFKDLCQQRNGARQINARPKTDGKSYQGKKRECGSTFKTKHGNSQDQKTQSNTLLVTDPGGQQGGQEQGDGKADRDKGEYASCQCVAYSEFVLYDRHKGRQHCPGGKIEVPQTPEKEEWEHFHGRSLQLEGRFYNHYVQPSRAKISCLLRGGRFPTLNRIRAKR